MLCNNFLFFLQPLLSFFCFTYRNPSRRQGQGKKDDKFVVDPSGLEPLTPALQMRCSSQLSYGPIKSVGDEGVGPSTSSLSEKRSTAELVARYILSVYFFAFSKLPVIKLGIIFFREAPFIFIDLS